MNTSTDTTIAGLSHRQQTLRRLGRNRPAVVAFIILCLLGLIAVAAPWLSPYSYSAQDLALGPVPPSLSHWLGTDLFGRDLLTRIIYGSRISLMVGIVATTVALVIGVLWGAVAGYVGGTVDNIMMRIVDIRAAVYYLHYPAHGRLRP
jgi:oligopeptide transport system permease protein